MPADLLKYNFKSVAQLFANIERAIKRPAAAVQVRAIHRERPFS